MTMPSRKQVCTSGSCLREVWRHQSRCRLCCLQKGLSIRNIQCGVSMWQREEEMAVVGAAF